MGAFWRALVFSRTENKHHPRTIWTGEGRITGFLWGILGRPLEQKRPVQDVPKIH